jgi:beta-lactam-binding protein with PASTA domain
MTKQNYQYGSQQPGVYVKRSPDTFQVVVTSVITSAVMTLVVLFVTGNLPLSQEEKPEPAGSDVGQPHSTPALIGMPVKSAGDLLTTRGLRMIVKAERSDKSEEGTIVEQEPLPDSQLQSGEAVTVVVSSGPGGTTVPKVVGKPLEEAKDLVKAAGIEIGDVSYTGIGEPGIVTQITPATGTLVEENTKADLTVAPNDIEAPEVTGMRIGKARQVIEEAGLKVGAVKWRYNEYRAANMVLAQNPKAKSRVRPGSEISLVVNEE